MEKLYTGAGDSGYTQTLSGRRISKSDPIIEFVGDIDEFTSVLGAAKACCSDKELFSDIEIIQKKLISVMGEISGGKLSITPECIKAAEAMCDKYYIGVLTEFALPGKNILSAQLDIARTVIRRAERTAVKVVRTGQINNYVVTYINRLSDVIFAMARFSEHKDEKSDVSEIEAGGGLSLAFAKEISLAVEMQAEKSEKSLVIAIADAGANIILLHSMDGAYIASCRIAQDKAYTSAALKMPTHTALNESRGGSLDGLTPSDGRICLLGGGYPLTVNNKIIGAIGVSGGTAEEDANFAHFGALYTQRRSEYDR